MPWIRTRKDIRTFSDALRVARAVADTPNPRYYDSFDSKRTGNAAKQRSPGDRALNDWQKELRKQVFEIVVKARGYVRNLRAIHKLMDKTHVRKFRVYAYWFGACMNLCRTAFTWGRRLDLLKEAKQVLLNLGGADTVPSWALDQFLDMARMTKQSELAKPVLNYVIQNLAESPSPLLHKALAMLLNRSMFNDLDHFYQRLDEIGAPYDSTIVSLFTRSHYLRRNYQGCIELFEQAEQEHVPPHHSWWPTWVGAIIHVDPSALVLMWGKMERVGALLDLHFYHHALEAAIDAQSHASFRMLATLLRRATIRTTPETAALLLRGHFALGHLEDAMNLWHSLSKTAAEVDRRFYRNLILGLRRNNLTSEEQAALAEARKLNLAPSVDDLMEE